MRKPKFGVNPFKPIKINKPHFGLDSDRDGLVDWKDCKPFDKHKHGVDVYLIWTGQRDISGEITKALEEGHNYESPKIKKLLKEFPRKGSEGYLRGAYFGGYSDLLEYLFGYWDWKMQPLPFGPKYQDEFEKRLDEISMVKSRRIDRGTKAFGGFPEMLQAGGWEIHTNDPNAPVEDWWLKECRDFLKLARRMTKVGKKVWVEISY
jgi:hypothetical protein